MAVYSKSHKFIFIHVPKNAGSTLIMNYRTKVSPDILLGFEELNAELGYERDPALGNHFTYQMIKSLCDRHSLPIDYQNYYKFCVVRNPWERMVSLFQHRLRKIDATTNGVPRNSPEDKALLKQGFEAWLLTTQNVSDRVLTKMSQLEWIRNDAGDIVCDRVIDVRNYDQEIMETLETLQMPRIPMEKFNVSAKDSSQYKSYYTAATRAHIEKYFAEDIDVLKYSFS
ncbi:sulfotransferase family protein [Blastopirellula sp. JC732]|uniref:Sulfotransferase family protein n=1 Tax=Blastopirellula sediminis TaxID=2894196 RepID=A0A9X1SL73_9BACT|nr:sulfotransferase family 2 domain-containing protein [Blastopirellula sediminis]MCC9606313.1 sulfotransferase family protein [Blastopirellula sediminis]MCC9630389.1 sulfotransferase family protein [Blastopirellula sediminis]